MYQYKLLSVKTAAYLDLLCYIVLWTLSITFKLCYYSFVRTRFFLVQTHVTEKDLKKITARSCEYYAIIKHLKEIIAVGLRKIIDTYY